MDDKFIEIGGKYHQALDTLTELANMLHAFTGDRESMEGFLPEGKEMVLEMKETVNQVLDKMENVGDGDFQYYLDAIKNYQDTFQAGLNPVFATEATAECYKGFYGGEVRRHRRFVYEVIPEGGKSTMIQAAVGAEGRKAA